MAKLIRSDDDLIPIVMYKTTLMAALIPKAYYYEWNKKEQCWTKLVESDPPPPSDIPPGHFDGQIVEIPKEPNAPT